MTGYISARLAAEFIGQIEAVEKMHRDADRWARSAGQQIDGVQIRDLPNSDVEFIWVLRESATG